MSNSIWTSLIEGVTSVLSYSPFIDALTLLGSVLVAASIKTVREKLTSYVLSVYTKLKGALDQKQSTVTGESIKNDDAITGRLYILLDKTKAARVNIYRFHNGEHFNMHVPMFKFTCTHEALSNGIVPDTGIVKRYIVSNYSDYILPMFDEHELRSGVENVLCCKKQIDNSVCKLIKSPMRVVKFTTDDLQYSVFKYLLIQQGTEVMYSVMLYKNDKSNPIGLINFHYITKDKPGFNDVPFCELCETIMEVQHLLY